MFGHKEYLNLSILACIIEILVTAQVDGADCLLIRMSSSHSGLISDSNALCHRHDLY